MTDPIIPPAATSAVKPPVQVANSAPEPDGAKLRKCRAMVPARHTFDPGRSPRPEVVAELDRAFAALDPPARRTGEPRRYSAIDMATITGSSPVEFAAWPEWWLADGEEVPR